MIIIIMIIIIIIIIIIINKWISGDLLTNIGVIELHIFEEKWAI